MDWRKQTNSTVTVEAVEKSFQMCFIYILSEELVAYPQRSNTIIKICPHL